MAKREKFVKEVEGKHVVSFEEKKGKKDKKNKEKFVEEVEGEGVALFKEKKGNKIKNEKHLAKR